MPRWWRKLKFILLKRRVLLILVIAVALSIPYGMRNDTYRPAHISDNDLCSYSGCCVAIDEAPHHGRKSWAPIYFLTMGDGNTYFISGGAGRFHAGDFYDDYPSKTVDIKYLDYGLENGARPLWEIRIDDETYLSSSVMSQWKTEQHVIDWVIFWGGGGLILSIMVMDAWIEFENQNTTRTGRKK